MQFNPNFFISDRFQINLNCYIANSIPKDIADVVHEYKLDQQLQSRIWNDVLWSSNCVDFLVSLFSRVSRQIWKWKKNKNNNVLSVETN